MTTPRKRTSLVSVVFFKELRETFRDKRVLLSVIISPLLVTPLLIGAVGFFAGKKSIETSQAVLPVGIIQEEAIPEIVEQLEANERLTLQQFDSRGDAEAAVLARKTRAVLVIKEGANEAHSNNGSIKMEILYSMADEKSDNARNRLKRELRAFDKVIVEQRLERTGLEATFVKPTKVGETSLASNESVGGFFLGLILPYIVVMSAAFGGMTTAFDLCAGEKERGTMETLLVSPASRYDIVQGKLFTIFTISVIATICAITGFTIPLASGLAIFAEVVGDKISFSFPAIGAMILIVIPLTLLTSSALLLISTFARNQKEAQTYSFPFIVAVMFPAVISSIIGAESPLYTAFIPVLNIALTMKQMLGELFRIEYFAYSLISSLVYAVIAMRIAARLFQREAILFRT